ncbi:MAG: tetratricopeptide repeat protein [Betaproteobacteria bacterium]|nr:tetratricopeptide repeat protein [Betaproteobacteria bacterium]
MKFRFLWLCIALAPGMAPAQTGTDAEKCRAITGNPDLAIKHCSAAIASGKLSGQALAQTHFNRGVEYASKGDHDRGIADYDAAIRIDPKFADAYHNRGTSWANKGEPDRAIADFDAALRLNDKDADIYHSRAIEWTVKGEYARALSDYDAVLRLDPKATGVHFSRGRTLFYTADYVNAIAEFEKAHQAQPSDYSAMWLFLARKRRGDENAEELLERDTRATRDGAWPTVLLALYVGQADAETAMKAAVDRDPVRQRERQCEADFYIAHWHLLGGAGERALPLLQEARRACPRNGIEYEGAVAELRKLAR